MHERLQSYFHLLRLNKPIGILLLLWPTLWALWLAKDGIPSAKIFTIFIVGVVLMRSAGCAMNDFADRNFDKHVTRTQDRPLTSGKIKSWEVLFIAAVLSFCAFCLVLFCNAYTIQLALMGAILTITYPLLKRITHLPQLGLGVAFSWGVPMAFAAQVNSIPIQAWFLFLTAMLWPIIYDTMYAMVDRDDDVRIGVKSMAIILGHHDKFMLALLQLIFIVLLLINGVIFHLKHIYFASVFMASILFIYQQWLIKDRDPNKCFHAFLNNNWVGLVIFAGIFLSLLT